MIKMLERYIAKTLIGTTLLTTVVIIGVLFLLLLLGELKNIGEGDYGILQAIFYVLLRLPNEIYQFSPMLILLGSMIGLNALSSQRELAVMRASGFSIQRIAAVVLLASFLLITMTALIGEWIGPNLSYQAEIHKENAQNAGQAVVTSAGVWLHIDNNFVHIQHVVGRQLLEDVTRYQFDDQHRLQAAYFAKKLIYENHEWVMKKVVETNFYHDRTKSHSFEEVPWDLKMNVNLFNTHLVDPSEMSLPKLIKFSHYLTENGLQASEYQFDFWRRLFQPLASLMMVFLAIPFVLGTFTTATKGSRIIMGIMTGFVFFISNAFLAQLCIVYQVPTFFAALLPPLFFAGVGGILVIKCREILR